MLIVVTGMHRSGTSAVAELLSAMGARLGPADQLMGTSPSNSRGHFESLSIVEMNDRILGAVGAHWLHPHVDHGELRQLAESSLADEARNALDRSGRGAAGPHPFVVKDPRFCLTLPFWRALLDGVDDPFVVLVYRRPDEVASSLHARNDLDPPYGHYLWHRYNQSAVVASEGLRRVAVSYGALLADASPLIERLCHSVDELAQPQVLTVDPKLRRQDGGSAIDTPSPALWSYLESLSLDEPRPPLEALEIPTPDGPTVMSALGSLVAEWSDLRLERERERVAHREFEAATSKALERLRDYEHSRAAGLARASWAVKRWLREQRHGVGRRQPKYSPPVEVANPVSVTTINNPDYSIVVHVQEQLPYTAACLKSIEEAAGDARYEVIVVDDSPPAGETAHWLSQCSGLRVVTSDVRLGLAAATNRGVEAATGRIVVLLDSKALARPGWLDAFGSSFERSAEIAAVGAKLISPDGQLQEAGGIVYNDGTLGRFGRNADPADPRFNVSRVVDYCSTRCLAVRRSAWDMVGGVDERLQAEYHGADLAFAFRDYGWSVTYEPKAVAVAFEDASANRRGSSDIDADQLGAGIALVEKWTARAESQPAPSSNPDIAAWRSVAGPHVLVVDHEVPAADQDSGSLRMTTILELLIGLGCRVTFVPANGLRREPYVGALQRLGVEVMHSWGGSRQPLDAVASDVAMMIVSRPLVASHLGDELRRRFPDAAFVYDMVDFHALREERQGSSGSTVEEIRAVERRTARAADVVLAISHDEADIMRRLEPSAAVEVLPNIHRPNRSRKRFGQRSGVLFVGSWRHPPNRDAIEWLAADIAPRIALADPSITVHVVGSDVPTDGRWTGSQNLVFHGWVPSLDELASSVRVNLAPLRAGAGLKGKVGDSLARGLPTVTTAIGAEGFGPVAEALVIRETADDIASAVVALHRDKEEWQSRADLGAALVEEHFGVAGAESVLRSLLAKLTGWSP